MILYLLLLLSILASIFTYFFVKRSKSKTINESIKRTFKLSIKESCSPDFLQAINIYDTSKNLAHINTLFTTLNYPIPFFSNLDCFFINLNFDIKTPCFYIFKKSIQFNHGGKGFSKPFLLNKSKYFVFGNISDLLHDFICKFDFEYFYCSYVPENSLESEKKYSTVELKTNLESVDAEFLDAFLKIFSTVEYENENKSQRIIKEYRLKRAQEESSENLGFFQKLDKKLAEMKK